MGSSFDLIKKYYNLCKPDEPIDPTDPRWVDLAPLRGSGRDIVSQILRQIELEERFATLLVTGFRGTGKTSLLRACRGQLEKAGYHVTHTDAEVDYRVNPHEAISVNDVLLTVAMALTDDGLAIGQGPSLLEDIKALLGIRLDPKEVEVGVGPVKIKAALERDPSLRDRLKSYAREHSLYEQVDSLVTSAQAQVKGKKQKGLVLVIDSLDHLSDPGERAGALVTESVLRVLRDAPELRGLGLHLILTAPPTILPYALELFGAYGELFIVPEARIVTKQDTRDGNAFPIMENFVHRRVPLTCFDSVESARSLIAASGGYLRDLLRLLQSCLIAVDELPITAQVVERTIQRAIAAANAELPLEDYRRDIVEILNSSDHRLPRDGEKLRRMYQMIRDRAVLRYLNDDHWEGIHPFVMAHVDHDRFQRLVFPAGQNGPAGQ